MATNLAYPVGDLLLLALVVGGSGVAGRPAQGAVAAACRGYARCNAVGDTFNLFGSSLGASHAGMMINAVAWPTAILVMSMAVWVRPGPVGPARHRSKAPGFLLPGSAPRPAWWSCCSGRCTVPAAVAIALAAATLLVVGVRLAMSVRGLRGSPRSATARRSPMT